MRELKSLDFTPLKMDPAGIYHKTNGKLDAVYGLHVDDAVAAGERNVLDKTHNEMEKRFEYGERKSLPYRFLGLNFELHQAAGRGHRSGPEPLLQRS